ncbi:MAG: ATP-binding cassette domain-containing protein [Actinomycetes bacterium]
MIEARGLSKRYGPKIAVDGLDFTIPPGRVTGFLGPNGAGKSTTMRMIVGLDKPTAGSVTVNGRRYRDHTAPLHEVGTLLEARAIQPGRTAFNHLLALAQTNGISRTRVEEVIDLVGLRDVAGKRVGGFSLGMGQRLGIGVALLGDPQVLVLDEPVNGLDPEGILWIRNLLTYLASEGKTVFVSSHLMSEMSLTAEHLIVIGRGKLIADMSVRDFVESSSHNYILVRSPQLRELQNALLEAGASVAATAEGALAVTGMAIAQVGDTAGSQRITLHELSLHQASLEQVFMDLTQDSVEFPTAVPTADDVRAE